MAYQQRPDYVGRSIRDLTGLVQSIPVQNAESERLAALTGHQIAKGDLDMRKFQKYEQPRLDRQAQEDQERWAMEDSPWNLETSLPGLDRADRLVWATQDQKTGGPVFDEYKNFVQRHRGVTFDENNNAYDKDGNIISNRHPMAGQLLLDWARHSGVYQLPTRAMDADRMFYQEVIQDPQAPPEKKQEAQARLEYLNNMGPKDVLNQTYRHMESLLMTKADNEAKGIEMPYIDTAIELAAKEVDRLHGALEQAGQNDFEMQKLKQQYDYMMALESKKQRGASGGKPTADIQWAQFLSEVKNIPLDQAADMVRSDKSMPQRLALAKAEIEAKEWDLMGQEEYPGQHQEIVDGILAKYQLDKVPGKKDEGDDNDDPLGIR